MRQLTRHVAENKLIECFSVSINNDGTRLASGGLDGNVKIWDVQTILQFKDIPEPESKDKKRKLDLNNNQHASLVPDKSLRRPLCSMSRHNGVVTSVKFSPDGRFLASGSDDKIVLIWEKDEEQANRPKQFGEAEADLEHWTVRKRLVAHDNDIQDICWSPDGALLVTVGLDRSIIIWNGLTFERIKRYDIHQSMVKGVVFDPANKFFATASDDRTVRIFRYYKKLNETTLNNYEFQMEHIVVDPFKKSPLTSYFRRMSWSPDGQHVAVPNATNGPVSSVAVINRGNWGTDISLIGHEAPCEVCSFSPRLFRSNDQVEDYNRTSKISTSNKGQNEHFSTILATAGQDQTLAVWSTSQSKPLIIAQDIVQNSITDICWTPNGTTLFMSCIDGSITCVIFAEKELGEVVSADVNDLQLHRYGADRESAIFAESTEQLLLELKANKLFKHDSAMDNKLTSLVGNGSSKLEESKPAPITKPAVEPKEPNRISAQQVNLLKPKKTEKLVQNVTKTKDGRKKVAPMLVSSLSKTSKPSGFDKPALNNTSFKKNFQVTSKISQTSYYLPRLGVQTSVHGIKFRSVAGDINTNNKDNAEEQDNDNEDMGIDLNNEQNPSQQSQNISGATLKKKKNKLKRSLMEARYPNCFKIISDLPEALFNNRAILNNEISQLLNQKDIMANSSASTEIDEDIIFQVLVSGIKHFKNPKYDFSQSDDINGNDNVKKTDHLITSIIEVRNGPNWSEDDDEMPDTDYSDRIDFQDPTTVTISNTELKDFKKYTLYFPYKIQHVLPVVMENILSYYVLVSFSGTVQIILAESGSYATPGIELGENIILLKQRGPFVMCLTNSGSFHCWKFPDNKSKTVRFESIMNGVSIASVINSDNDIKIPETNSATKRPTSIEIPSVVSKNVRTIEINPRDGSPFVVLEADYSIFAYSIELMVWTRIIDPWYFSAIENSLINKLDGTKLVNTLIKKNFGNYHHDVKRMKIGKYNFANPQTFELKDVMKGKFEESIELATA